MTINIEISTSTAALKDDHDQVAAILHDLADEIENGVSSFAMILRDSDGDEVGTCTQAQDEELPDESVGDVYQVPGGFSIVVPDGRWELSRQQAHYLANTLLNLMKRKG